MASLRNTAQRVLEEARDGIAWIALYKEGRGWGAGCFWPDLDRNGEFQFDEDDIQELKEILTIDPNAIFVNGYYSNLGPLYEMTREILASALRWQYENQYNQLADAMPAEAPCEPSTETALPGLTAAEQMETATKEIKVEDCENFIKAQFAKIPFENGGIYTGLFWDLAEKAGLWERGTYGSPMSVALGNLTRVETVNGPDREFCCHVFRLKDKVPKYPPKYCWEPFHPAY